MDIDEISYKIRGCCYEVYNVLGPGLLESVYEQALMIELAKNGLKAQNQVRVPVVYKGVELGDYLIVDIIVEDQVVVELKSVENLLPVHSRQLLTYLKLTNKKLGLLINFNVTNMNAGIRRIVN